MDRAWLGLAGMKIDATHTAHYEIAIMNVAWHLITCRLMDRRCVCVCVCVWWGGGGGGGVVDLLQDALVSWRCP